ncbi:MAG: hypothetical protein HOJ61_07215 [Gammaproteobacteria bacterium]|nr:hypothetical protein [Gammaproteobacteria bacterium]MBT5602011.1 hypothetical protein [Gammaproteobacteria bacterium]MBT6246491.1 hypothetical protein [Gammaproteobacteria bacterium]
MINGFKEFSTLSLHNLAPITRQGFLRLTRSVNFRHSRHTGNRFLVPVFACLVSLSGCSTTQVITANSAPAVQIQESIPDALLLDIAIQPFDPNIPSPDSGSDDRLSVSTDVRRAESRYIASHLKDTLEQTGNWGTVRVIPMPSKASQLNLTGKILVSDGEILKVAIKVSDAKGRPWLNKVYDDTASRYGYQTVREDPFQDLYNNIANDLIAFHQNLDEQKISEIQTLAQIRFAADLAPDAFKDYISTSRNGQISVTQLPAENDLIINRVKLIKTQDELLIDTLDDYYGQFYREMKPSYDEWRYATYEEVVKLRQIKKQARGRLLGGVALIAGGLYAGSESNSWAGNAATAGAVVGGIGAIKSGLDRLKQAEIHEQALKELTQSLGMEITPNILEIEGRTIELTGSADKQFDDWRGILREIYAEETNNTLETQATSQ